MNRHTSLFLLQTIFKETRVEEMRVLQCGGEMTIRSGATAPILGEGPGEGNEEYGQLTF